MGIPTPGAQGPWERLMFGPVDIMMHLRGQQRPAMDFYDTPKIVRTLGARCTEIYVGTVCALSAAVPDSFL